MPHMTGTQFLLEAIKLYPDARRVLLTAYADTETAITAINQIGLDHYLLKPWEPPTERLYPVLEDLLSDWFARARPAFDGHPRGRHRALAGELRGEGLPRREPGPLPVARHGGRRRPSRELLAGAAAAMTRLPMVFFPDGTHAGAAHHPRSWPSRIGLQTRAQKPFYDLIVDRRRAGGSRGRGVRRVGGAAHDPRRAQRARRPGGDELEHRELSRVPERRHRRRSRAPRGDARRRVSAPRSSRRRRRSRSGARTPTAR